jgi:hypothetical protein
MSHLSVQVEGTYFSADRTLPVSAVDDEEEAVAVGLHHRRHGLPAHLEVGEH